jgi:SAM-dependent methyltransferase
MNTPFTGDEALDVMSENAPNRNNFIEQLIRKYIFENLPKGARVLEFGAGKGQFVFRFYKMENIELLATEIDENYLKTLSTVVKTYTDLDDIPGQLDGIFLIDVLEHIENDAEFVRKFYSKLKPNGRLFIYVPARMELYTEWDKNVGHYRRYTLPQLKKVVTDGGFKIKKARYHELLSYFASLAGKVMKGAQENPKAVKFYDSVIVRSTNFIERFVPAPIGKSIWLYAEKEA